MNMDKLLEELYSYSMFNIKLGLENIKELCKHLGNPQKNYKVIHVTGTNGKGSVSTTIEKILLEAGFNVGKYTSPHILKFNERISINEKFISDEDIAFYYEKVKRIIEEYSIKATFFEVTTAIMFIYFSEKKVDYVILEAGMGGKYDATNICDSIISIITNVSLEHTEYLGDTVYKIAKEKAGIIKNSPYTIFSDNNPDVEKAIAEETSSYTNVLKKYEKATYVLDFNNFTTNITIDNELYEFSLFGDYQFKNFLCAYEVAKRLNIDKSILKKAFRNVVWQCRFEVFSKNPLVIFDGAHNSNGIDELCRILKNNFSEEEVCILISVLKDKNKEEMFRKIKEVSSDITITSIPDNPRGCTAQELYDTLSCKEGFSHIENPIEAYNEVLKKNKKITICCGSFYLLIKLKEGLNHNE